MIIRRRTGKLINLNIPLNKILDVYVVCKREFSYLSNEWFFTEPKIWFKYITQEKTKGKYHDVEEEKFIKIVDNDQIIIGGSTIVIKDPRSIEDDHQRDFYITKVTEDLRNTISLEKLS